MREGFETESWPGAYRHRRWREFIARPYLWMVGISHWLRSRHEMAMWGWWWVCVVLLSLFAVLQAIAEMTYWIATLIS